MTQSNYYPSIVPIFDLSGVVLLPRGQLPLQVSEPKYVQIIKDAMGEGRYVGLAQPSQQNSESKLFAAGCLGKITTFVEVSENSFFVIISGLIRFHIEEEMQTGKFYRSARVSYDSYFFDCYEERESMKERDKLFQILKNFISVNTVEASWEDLYKASDETLISLLAFLLPFEPNEKQAILESHSLEDRSRMIMALMEMAYLKDINKRWSHH